MMVAAEPPLAGQNLGAVLPVALLPGVFGHVRPKNGGGGSVLCTLFSFLFLAMYGQKWGRGGLFSFLFLAMYGQKMGAGRSVLFSLFGQGRPKIIHYSLLIIH